MIHLEFEIFYVEIDFLIFKLKCNLNILSLVNRFLNYTKYSSIINKFKTFLSQSKKMKTKQNKKSKNENEII